MNIQGKLIGVTGASGMLGVYISRALLAAGARVRGVVRNPQKAAFLANEGVEFAKADLEDRDSLTEAFRGCDAVIANAALYNNSNRRWDDNFRANKVGTENVYEAAGAAGVPRVVHISTFGVYRWFPLPESFNESTPLLDGEHRKGGAYRATKQLSEALAFELSAKHGIAVTALRPAGIYGARDQNLLPTMRKLMSLPLIPAPKLHFPFVHAGDVANAVVGALRNDASADKAYLIAGRDESVESFMRAWKTVTNARGALLPLPLGQGFRVDTSLAEREIEFSNRSYEAGLKETFEAEAAYRAAGLS
ncbi:MAG TPA: NAD-dependent epimerase/dehydratase family protein [Polyangiales bacterium]|nr:NAD-dependent epimerase/dehydratase family protein [Polyangiales bacterium]